MRMKKPVLGMTGGVGAGKSTVLSYLQEKYHAQIIQCDLVARQLQEPVGACYEEIRALFGPYGCFPDGQMDRKAVARILFSDNSLLEKVNSIVHPAVFAEVQRLTGRSGRDYADVSQPAEPAGQLSEQTSVRGPMAQTMYGVNDEAETCCALIVVEAALLLQGGYDRICDEIWYVYAPVSVRSARLAASRGYTEERIRDMIAAQPSEDFFRQNTQLTIDNSSDNLNDTYRQIDRGLMTHGFLQYCQRQQR